MKREIETKIAEDYKVEIKKAIASRLRHFTMDQINSDENLKKEVLLGCFNRNLRNVHEKDTNRVFAYLGDYYADASGMGNSFSFVKEVRVSEGDPRAEYRKYQDFEQYNPVCVSIDRCAQFEKMNTVIRSSKNYQELKLDYVMLQFGWLLDDEQEKTINSVLK